MDSVFRYDGSNNSTFIITKYIMNCVNYWLL